MSTLLKQTPKQIVEEAMIAAMITKSIPEDFKISQRALKVMYDSIETFIAREDEDAIYNMVSAFLVGYHIGWIDSEHPNKHITNYSEQSE